MGKMKNLKIELENLVVEAYEAGARNDHDVLAYVRMYNDAPESIVLEVINELFPCDEIEETVE